MQRVAGLEDKKDNNNNFIDIGRAASFFQDNSNNLHNFYLLCRIFPAGLMRITRILRILFFNS